MLSVALHLSSVPNFASRPHPQRIEKHLVPNYFKHVSPYSDYLSGTLLYMVIEVKFDLF